MAAPLVLTSTWGTDALQMLPTFQGGLTKNWVETLIGAQTNDKIKTVVYEAGIMACVLLKEVATLFCSSHK